MIFIDSKTSAKSVAEQAAKDAGLYYGARDVFLDHVPTDEFLQNSLALLEKKALAKGYAIAIGHPKSVTINALRAWIPTLKDKGLELAPVSAVLKHSSAKPDLVPTKIAKKND